MRLPHLVLAAFAATFACGLGACSSTHSGGPGLSETFNTDNYRRSNDTNGTQRRPDVNRLYTQPTLPTIGNRGF
ncbi:hypothetical protein [Methylobacterium organophilum]|uniref:Lipoprotein n=1 Tax=Methylobacterium organophilum TaxID=410 RepID=A0ABQ4TDS6_METOR|nr:hypothetical protein [Methylobacterium organophilum]GJE28674.1 hypothetical protein LKMONMHP_3547 [Methylobacterium organophilum]